MSMPTVQPVSAFASATANRRVWLMLTLTPASTVGRPPSPRRVGPIRAGHPLARQPRRDSAAGELDEARAAHPAAKQPLLRVELCCQRRRLGRERRDQVDADAAPEGGVECKGDRVEGEGRPVAAPDSADGEPGAHRPSARHLATSRAIAGAA